MRHVDLRPALLGNQPVLRHRHAIDGLGRGDRLLDPLVEVDGARKRREQDELRERQVGPLRQVRASSSNVSARSLGRPKMNEPRM